MKLHFSLLFFALTLMLNAQTIDYNTKRGTAVGGYDVVAYFNGTPEKGSSEFVHKYDGITYKFSSQENLKTFIANPNTYLPQYGGYCAYAIAKKGKKVGIDPKTFEIRNGKLYLFYNSWGNNTLENWLEEQPKELIKRADINWKNIN
ncbi:YHS domain-containing (seleno)protein [Ichthyenterobacterium sp. W332]|uniref:YHS domain-containing (Seleno)protein n=1 Tax=Microcosmobacter mediterraneus TaxID=3075607 RepID=A0ABU2YLH0_9FLAO|nr:YHS domain-containing (seleno)protein [Ichthyenterobacterium sp. W332]MDT0558995.1 YHS domain-containing (seleno)protein [Ichthyenterobacterium sp. W332]